MYIYYHDYKTLITPISIDTELGFNLKDANDPNKVMLEYLSERRLRYTYIQMVAKLPIPTSALRVSICPALNVEIIKRTIVELALFIQPNV